MTKRYVALCLSLVLILISATGALAAEERGLLRGATQPEEGDAVAASTAGGEADPLSVGIDVLGLRLSVPEGWQIVKTYDTASLIDFDLITDDPTGSTFAFTATKADAYQNATLSTLSDEQHHSLLWLAGIYEAESILIEQGLLGQITLDVIDMETSARHLLILWQGWLLDVSADPQGGELSRQDKLLQLTFLSILDSDVPETTAEPAAAPEVTAAPEDIVQTDPTPEPEAAATQSQVYQMDGRKLVITPPDGYVLSDFSSDSMYVLSVSSLNANPLFIFMQMAIPGLSSGDDLSLLSDADIQDVVESVASEIENPNVEMIAAEDSPYGLMTLILTSGDGTYWQWMFIEDGKLYSGVVTNASGVTQEDQQTLSEVFVMENE